MLRKGLGSADCVQREKQLAYIVSQSADPNSFQGIAGIRCELVAAFQASLIVQAKNGAFVNTKNQYISNVDLIQIIHYIAMLVFMNNKASAPLRVWDCGPPLRYVDILAQITWFRTRCVCRLFSIKKFSCS